MRKLNFVWICGIFVHDAAFAISWREVSITESDTCLSLQDHLVYMIDPNIKNRRLFYILKLLTIFCL